MARHFVGYWKDGVTYDDRGQMTLEGFVTLETSGSADHALELKDHWMLKIAKLIHDYHNGGESLDGLPLDLRHKIKSKINPPLNILKFIQDPDKKDKKKKPPERKEKEIEIRPGQAFLCREGEGNI